MDSHFEPPNSNSQPHGIIQTQGDANENGPNALPGISLPKGGGAIKGIGEQFSLNAITGTASTSVPFPCSQSRSSFTPQLNLSYDSGAGNGIFGFGWNISLPSISRKTDKGLPRYDDTEDSDIYVLTGAEELLPVLSRDHHGKWARNSVEILDEKNTSFIIRRYRPRVEGLLSQIERWTNSVTGEIFWKVVSKDNVVSVFGSDQNSRIYDPGNPLRVFSWLLSRTYDGKGNAMKYEYKEEDSAGVDITKPCECRRTDHSRSANRYPKRIKYGNRTSGLTKSFNLESEQWMFEVVFDYGDHSKESPSIDEAQSWPSRSDPFSTFRPTFDLRTYRLCERILMFHNFPEELNVGSNCLVFSLDLKYADVAGDSSIGNSIASFISSISHTAHLRQNDGYLHTSLPPLEFEYTRAEISDAVSIIDPESLENLPSGLQDLSYQFLDLDGEGIDGILSRQGGGFFYKSNLGNGQFGPAESVTPLPSLFRAPNSAQQWLDLSGDGKKSLVQFDGVTPGYYKRNSASPGNWEGFKTFSSLPIINFENANLKFVDLRGTGLADILIVDEEIFTYYPACTENSFGIAGYWRPPLHEDAGPKLVMSNGESNIYLADFSGDGLSDLVRIRNGEVCYWPNQGYGQFGAKISMGNSPWFDDADQFTQNLVRLGDVDGSGTTDIVYLGSSGATVYLNRSGNSWSDSQPIQGFPLFTEVTNVQLVDLLGNGTSCLVWSSSSPADSGQQMRYINLLRKGKPHLMTSMINNMGSEIRVKYEPSTKFYLDDKESNNPWATRLPFPVQVVSEIEKFDRISGNRFVSRYAYHEGYYDGVEREFRGFGFVESWDTDAFATSDDEDTETLAANPTNFDPQFTSPPVWTKTWYHTGAYFENMTIMDHFRSRFYAEPGLNPTEKDELLLPETEIPRSIQIGRESLPYELSTEEQRESYRSLRGSILREEIYALDGTCLQAQPYQVKQYNYLIDMLQPRSPNRYAMFFTHPKESVQFYYDRSLFVVSGQQLADPRISHTLNLSTDEYGNVLESVSINYGRRHVETSPYLKEEDRVKQKKMVAVLTLQKFTNSVQEYDSYRTPLLFDKQAFELLNIQRCLQLTAVQLIRAETLKPILSSVTAGRYDLPFQDFLGDGVVSDHVYRRRLSRMRTVFRSDDLSRQLPFGRLESLALPYEKYSQVFTKALAEESYIGSERFVDRRSLVHGMENEGRFIHVEGDNNWWSSSGKVFYSPNSSDSPMQEVTYARDHFYLASRYRDPFYSSGFNTESFVLYDKYDLLVVETRDAMGNQTTIGTRTAGLESYVQSHGYDYRLLAPILSMDPNRNRMAIAYDVLGHVTATAVMGKIGRRDGDELSGFITDMTQSQISEYFHEPLETAKTVLGNATSRNVYDLWAYYKTRFSSNPLPVVSATLSRDTHVANLIPGQKPQIQQSILYSDGFGRAIQTKTLAEPDPSTQQFRWIASSWQIFNNKGNVVRKYEPFFTAANSYESNFRAGVSSTLFYDPLQRVVATLSPNHTWQKTRFDPWHQEAWDQNDTVLTNPAGDTDVSAYFRRLPESDYLPTWFEARSQGELGVEEQYAATKAAVHANTPRRSFFDPLGRSIVAVSHNALQRAGGSRTEEFYTSRTLLDISGNIRSYTDNLGRIVETSCYDMLNMVIQKSSMEAGEKWSLFSVIGKPLFSWNSREYQFRTTYDQIQRPSDTWIQQAHGPEYLVSRNIYGESEGSPEVLNLRTKIVKTFDQSTLKELTSYDFKGNLISATTQFMKHTAAIVDWSDVGLVELESEIFKVSTSYDALNRSILETQPDNSMTRKVYNVTGQVHRVDVKAEESEDWKSILADELFNARSQSILCRQGNGSRTTYEYDSLTFSLKRLVTREPTRTSSSKSCHHGGSCIQDLLYTYDPVKNITHTRDNAQQRVFFQNQVVDPSSSYTYDAIYRLIEATGREHLSQSGASVPYGPLDHGQTGLHNPSNGKAMGTYTESYFLDSVGNILRLQHTGSDATQAGWSRRYKYEQPSQLQPGAFSNRLTTTTVGKQTETYEYEGNAGLNGNITSMAHLSSMQWDFRDHLQSTASQNSHSGTPQTTWYSYGDDGSRTRKITNRFAKSEEAVLKKSERFYLGTFEIYREYGGDGRTVTLERKSLHVLNGTRRTALIDTQTLGEFEGPKELVRYQYTNNLDSAVLELDEECNLISYEEYYPYGSTSYQAVKSKLSSPKRYRYTGKERDEESGFDYHGARYYAPWTARWISPDPIGGADDTNLYVYVKCNPMTKADPTGTTSEVKNTWGTGPDPASAPAPPPKDPDTTPIVYPPPEDTTAEDTKKTLHFPSDDDPDIFFKPIDNAYNKLESIWKGRIKVVINPLAPPIVDQTDNPYPNAGATTTNPIEPFPAPGGDHFNSNDPNAPIPNGGPVPNTLVTLSLTWRDAPPPPPKKDDPPNQPKQFPLGQMYDNPAPISTDPIEGLDWADGAHRIPDPVRDALENDVDKEKQTSSGQPGTIIGSVPTPKPVFPTSPVQLHVPPPTYLTPQPILIPVPKLQLNNMPPPPHY